MQESKRLVIPGFGRSPGGVHGNPLQYSCLENSLDRGAWWATDHRVAKSQTRLSDSACTHACICSPHSLIATLQLIEKPMLLRCCQLTEQESTHSQVSLMPENHEMTPLARFPAALRSSLVIPVSDHTVSLASHNSDGRESLFQPHWWKHRQI